MSLLISKTQPKGYLESKDRKDTGAHYTPVEMANFLAHEIVKIFDANGGSKKRKLNVLDPAIGDGVLLKALLKELDDSRYQSVDATGFDIDHNALNVASQALREGTILKHEDFLEHVLQDYLNPNSLFSTQKTQKYYDLVITNPPYIRTQVLGANKSRSLSENFGLSGRIDIYHAFLKAISSVMIPGGYVGLIVSNRFMTTQAGATARSIIKADFDIVHIWDLGDTRMFEAAVLPALLLLKKRSAEESLLTPRMTSVYSVSGDHLVPTETTENIFSVLHTDSMVRTKNEQTYLIQNGELDSGSNSWDIWRLSSKFTDDWLRQVSKQSYCLFGDLGKIRVGIKTTADKVFIREDWDDFSNDDRPELLRPLITHHISDHFKARDITKGVLYTHEVSRGKKVAINLNEHPKSLRYLTQHRQILQERDYIRDAGRNWYEIWVPQDPDEWKYPKIVFRDISKRPYFWLDDGGAIVNGDCYWIGCKEVDKDLMYLALAVANSRFITLFYDRKFNNKLYAGRRRFITQYVKDFPIPNPSNPHSKEMVVLVEKIMNSCDSVEREFLREKIDTLIWHAFDLPVEKVSW